MTCNFKSITGADLDDLFYIANDNAGALGYVDSTGADLGNKYTDKSTLGYTVGYYNKAGTDMGFLRGNKTDPTITTVTVSNNYAVHYEHDNATTSGTYTQNRIFATFAFSCDETITKAEITTSLSGNLTVFNASSYVNNSLVDYVSGSPSDTLSVDVGASSFSLSLYVRTAQGSISTAYYTGNYVITLYGSSGSITYASPTYLYSATSSGGTNATEIG